MTSVKKAFDSGAIPASQSEHLSYAEKFFGIQRYSSLLSGDNKNPRRKFFVKTLKNLRYGFRGRVFPGCNITTVRAPKQALGADWSDRGRTSKPRYFSRWYFLFRSLFRYKLREAENGILNGLNHKTRHTRFTSIKRTFNLKNIVPWIH